MELIASVSSPATATISIAATVTVTTSVTVITRCGCFSFFQINVGPCGSRKVWHALIDIIRGFHC